MTRRDLVLGATLILGCCLTYGTTNAADLVINEIDYDQPGTDAAEFIELKNTSPTVLDLSGFLVELVNGNGGGAVIYATIPLPSVLLAPGDYFVICANGANTANCDLDVTPDTNLIQNGAPDAVAVRRVGAGIEDTVSYEGNSGAPYTEGSGIGLDDDAANGDAGISRIPDGGDTNQNNVDLSYRCITPGLSNTTAAPPGCEPVPVEASSWGFLKSTYR